MVRQEPEDVDPDGWVDIGELTELPEISLKGRPEDPEEMAVREGIH